MVPRETMPQREAALRGRPPERAGRRARRRRRCTGEQVRVAAVVFPFVPRGKGLCRAISSPVEARGFTNTRRCKSILVGVYHGHLLLGDTVETIEQQLQTMYASTRATTRQRRARHREWIERGLEVFFKCERAILQTAGRPVRNAEAGPLVSTALLRGHWDCRRRPVRAAPTCGPTCWSARPTSPTTTTCCWRTASTRSSTVVAPAAPARVGRGRRRRPGRRGAARPRARRRLVARARRGLSRRRSWSWTRCVQSTADAAVAPMDRGPRVLARDAGGRRVGAKLLPSTRTTGHRLCARARRVFLLRRPTIPKRMFREWSRTMIAFPERRAFCWDEVAKEALEAAEAASDDSRPPPPPPPPGAAEAEATTTTSRRRRHRVDQKRLRGRRRRSTGALKRERRTWSE